MAGAGPHQACWSGTLRRFCCSAVSTSVCSAAADHLSCFLWAAAEFGRNLPERRRHGASAGRRPGGRRCRSEIAAGQWVDDVSGLRPVHGGVFTVAVFQMLLGVLDPGDTVSCLLSLLHRADLSDAERWSVKYTQYIINKWDLKTLPCQEKKHRTQKLSHLQYVAYGSFRSGEQSFPNLENVGNHKRCVAWTQVERNHPACYQQKKWWSFSSQTRWRNKPVNVPLPQLF